jgi:hypothetical protein
MYNSAPGAIAGGFFNKKYLFEMMNLTISTFTSSVGSYILAEIPQPDMPVYLVK